MNNSRVSGRGESLRSLQFSLSFFFISLSDLGHMASLAVHSSASVYSAPPLLILRSLFVTLSSGAMFFFRMFSLLLFVFAFNMLPCLLLCRPPPILSHQGFCPGCQLCTNWKKWCYKPIIGALSAALGSKTAPLDNTALPRSQGSRNVPPASLPLSRRPHQTNLLFTQHQSRCQSMDPLKPNQVAQFHKTLQNQTTRLSNKGKQPAQSLHYLLSLSHRRHFTDAASAMIKQA